MRAVCRVLACSFGLLAAITVTVALSCGPAIAQTAGPPQSWKFLGTWKFNASKSDLRTARLRFTSSSGEMTMTYSGYSYTFRIDGKARPSILGSTAIWTQTGPRSWKTVYRLAGKDNNIDSFTLSADGQSLAMKTERFVPRPAVETLTFTRVSGGPGLVGVWQTANVENVDLRMTLASSDAKQVAITWSWGGSALVPIDGRAVPVKGDPAVIGSGMTASFKLTGPSAFELTLASAGQQISSAHYVVGGDGRIMTADVFNGPPGPEQERTKVSLDKQ